MLAHDHHAALGVAYGLGSIGGGLLAAYGVSALARRAAGGVTGAPCGSASALVSGAGACLRFLLDTAVQRRAGEPFPARHPRRQRPRLAAARPAARRRRHGRRRSCCSGTALLGSFTTFSTWMVQSERLAAEGETAASRSSTSRAAWRSASPRSCSAGRSARAL